MKKLGYAVALSALLAVPALAQAQTICNTGNPGLCDPTGAGDLTKFLPIVFSFVGIMIGGFAILMLVVSAFRMVTSQGNEESVSKAKTSLRWTLIGFVVVISAFAIVVAILNFFGSNPASTPPQTGIVSPIASSDWQTLLSQSLSNGLTIIATLALLYIIIAGVRYLTARGNDEQTANAKRGLTWAIAGLVLALFAYVIVAAVAKLFPSS